MDTRKAQLGREWQALTPEHERQLESTMASFDAFEAGETVDPLSIVGAYRSGKTQLIYHLFTNTWERGIPAFYIGDPGAMLSNYQESGYSQLHEWIADRIDEQLEAYAAGDADAIDWFPNVDSESKQAFIDRHGEVDPAADNTKTALFFDEVEQSYRDFIQAMDKDDDNPLRKINDNLQDTIKVWSFGMISAFEFIGEADWGRMKEIRIPPLSVADVRDVLEDRRPEAADLANTIWWLARGRTGLIIKLIDELPADTNEGAIDWLKTRAEADFKDTRLINNIWAELDHDDWDPAIRTLLFRDGLDNWQIDDGKALSSEDCLTIAVNIIRSEFEFSDSEQGQNAVTILERNLDRVFRGLAIGEDQLFPRFGLMDDEEADAFLDLVENTVVSFEPASPERQLTIDTLDDVKGNFSTIWIQQVSDSGSAVELIDQRVATASPVKIRDAFPPIAVNPERVAARNSTDLREEMQRGIELRTGDPIDDIVTIRFCPTESAAAAELKELTRRHDITDPTVLVVPEDETFDLALDEDVATYDRHNLLEIVHYQSNRFWSFVVNLYGRLEAEGRDPYFMDPATIQELLELIDEREVRNTIETLYDQLNQVALEEARKFAATYRETYTLPNTDTLLWEEERLSGQSPYFSTGRFDEIKITLSYLPVFGPEYESTRMYAGLHRHLAEAIDMGLVSGGASGFGYTEYLDNMFTQNGYSPKKVNTERRHYRSGEQLAPAVLQTQSALTALAGLNNLSEIIPRIDDPEMEAEDGEIPVIGVEGLSSNAYAFYRALLIVGLTKGTHPEIDVAARLQELVGRLEDEKTTLESYIETVESLNSDLTAPESAEVGAWIDIKCDRLQDFRRNLENIIEGTVDLIDKCQSDSSAAPIGYHYWFLIQEYLDDIGESIDDFESDIHSANVNQISDARSLFNSVHEQIRESDAIALHFDSQERLLSRIETLGDDIFNLERHHGGTSISLPEDLEDLRELNDMVEEHIETLHNIDEDLSTIESESESLEAAFNECKAAAEALLTPEKVEQ